MLQPDLPEAIIYTDGSGGQNGNGGWAALIATPFYAVEVMGYAIKTTSNRMEMTAAIEGLKELKLPHKVTLVSDSAYLVNAIEKDWFLRWFEEQDRGHERPNIDLWHALHDQLKIHNVIPVKIKGHSGNEPNTRVDKLAVQARKSLESGRIKLYGNAPS